MQKVNTIILNGVEYAITDKQALEIAALLQTKVNSLEKEVDELRIENEDLRNELDWAFL